MQSLTLGEMNTGRLLLFAVLVRCTYIQYGRLRASHFLAVGLARSMALRPGLGRPGGKGSLGCRGA